MSKRFITKTAIHFSIATALIAGLTCAAPAQATSSATDTGAVSLDVFKGKTRATNGFQQGQCTWLAQERFKQAHGYYMDIWGDAHSWNDSAKAAGWNVRTDRPFANSVVVFEKGVADTSRQYGHVAWVTSAGKNSKGGWQMHIEEANWDNNPNPTKRYNVQWGPGMSVITNHG